MRKLITLALLAVFATGSAFGQEKDQAKFKEYEPGYYENFILKDVRAVKKDKKEEEKEKKFLMDQSGMDLPNKMDLYENEVWHTPTISQGNAGTCWAYSTTSFYESEVKRLHDMEVNLSEIYTVYWEYVEKARRYVKKRGDSRFTQGSEANAVTRMYKKYGIVPNSVYDGLPEERKFHSHAAMYKEMRNYLENVKKEDAWNEKEVLATIKSIMNHHIGQPPSEFEYEGEMITPKEYLHDVLKLNLDNYVEILSYKQKPYWEQVEYEVPDNWWNSEEYYNVPLNVFMDVVEEAIAEGYSMSIGGDVSEAGFSHETNCAIVPTFDIPAQYINENSRQFRFSNSSTTDDHGMHLVGSTEYNGDMWYLIKDSSSGSRDVGKDSPIFGYYFFHEDYIKLKMMNFTIHKDAVEDVLEKF
ncbi:MAG: C1 family peptidase [Bacteroidales bacterium]|nr:C1 family peptidase [Bacteroidales bacterium]MCF8338104.1 C1 family peptidase [Bacteroidales bacterium]